MGDTILLKSRILIYNLFIAPLTTDPFQRVTCPSMGNGISELSRTVDSISACASAQADQHMPCLRSTYIGFLEDCQLIILCRRQQYRGRALASRTKGFGFESCDQRADFGSFPHKQREYWLRLFEADIERE